MINKKLTIFEFTVISFLFAVILSIGIVYSISLSSSTTPSFPLNYITLSVLLDKLEIARGNEMSIGFIYYVIVFTLYGLVLGIINKYSNKIKYLSIAIVCLVAFLISQEFAISKANSNLIDSNIINSASVIRSIQNKDKKYFGFETRGDLNSDNREDVAFIIKRKDEIRGDLYYLSASLRVDDGYEGLNLLFLGDKVVPTELVIENGIIGVAYNKQGVSTTTQLIYYAKLVDNEIKELVY